MANEIIRQQAIDMMVTAVKELAPELDLRPGTPQYDTLINPVEAIIAATVEQNVEAERRRNAALFEWETLTAAEADAEAARYFTKRFLGGKTVGSVRVKFKKAVNVNLRKANIIRADDLVYHPHVNVSAADTTLARDAVLGYYYLDFVVEADENGGRFDLPPGTEVTIDAYDGDENVIEAITVGPLTGGYDDETNVELYRRVQRNQTQRNLVSALSIEALLKENFTSIIRDIRVIGFQEPEMLRDQIAVIDQHLNQPITLRMGGFTDVYVKTPIVRQTVEVFLPSGEAEIDLAPWRAVLKIHSVRDKDEPEVTPFYAMIGLDPALRYSGADPVKLFIDPGVGGRTLLIDMSYAPDVPVIHAYCQSEPVRLTCANLIVRFFHPVWLSANIFVQGGIGLEVEIAQAITSYLETVRGDDPVVVSKITEAIHSTGTAMVFQDYELTAEVHLDAGPPMIRDTSTTLNIEPNYVKGFSPRVATYINEGIRVTPIS